MLKTTSIKVRDKKIKSLLSDHIFAYRHFENMYIILLKMNRDDFNLLSDYGVMRAVLRDNEGGKKSEEVKLIQDKFQYDELFKQLKEHSKDLKIHNLVMIMRRVKGDYKRFFTNLKAKVKSSPPSAKKLALLSNYSIPIDVNAWSLRKKNQVGLNLGQKMFYTHIYFDRLKNIVGEIDNIQSIVVKYSNKEIYLQIAYKPLESKIKTRKTKKAAGLDIGINNLATLFVDDKTTQSLIVDGSQYKHYNSKFNRFNAKLNKSIADNVLEFKDVTRNDKTTKYASKWNNRGKQLKSYKTYLIEKRNQYFKNEFHKVSKRLSEYCLINNVTDLYISRNLTFAKSDKKGTKLGKSTQNFIQIPFGRMLDYLQYKLEELGVRVHEVDEAYTSKTSCINADVKRVQRKQQANKAVSTNDLNASRVKRGLLKDNISNVVFNADLNGAVNHIKVATNKKLKWLMNYMDKLNNPVKIKSDYEFNNLLLNSVSNKAILSELRLQRCIL